MKKADIKAVVENRFRELRAKQVELLEWTDNHSYASNYCFEDIEPMPYDISEQEIIWQVDKLLM